MGFTIYIGDDVYQRIQVQLNGLPVDLTDATEILCTLRNGTGETDETQTFTLTGKDIVIDNAVQGTFFLNITAAETAQLLAQDPADIDFTVTITTAVLSTTATSVLGSATLTAVASVAGLRKGQAISGTGIPAGTTIDSFTSNTITLSADATASGSGVAVTVTSVLEQTYRVPNGLSVVERNT
jgi:hypothetical protein